MTNGRVPFEFAVDKERSVINVKREFAAHRDLVWDIWTKAEFLDKWWAPKPYRAETKTLDFRVGGMWLYCMVSPQDDRQWCRADYQAIERLESFSYTDSFCKEDGTPTDEIPAALWAIVFVPNTESTVVDVTISFKSLADLEQIIELGFKEGFTSALGNIDEMLPGLTV